MKLNNIAFSLLLLVGFSCNSNNSNYSIKEIKQYKIDFPGNCSLSANQILGFGKIKTIKNKTYIYFYDWNIKKAFIIDIEKSSLIKEIDLQILDSVFHDHKRADMKMISKDSLAIFSYKEQKLAILNRNAKLLFQCNTYPPKRQDIEALAYWDKKYDYKSGKFFFINSYDDIVLKDTSSFKKYFLRKCDLVIDITSKEIEYRQTSKFPYKYRLGNYFGDTDFYRCIDDKGRQIYSFTASDSLYIFKDTLLIKKVYSGSKTNPEFTPFNTSKMVDFSYTQDYVIEEPRYQKIVFDPVKQKYYRAFKHRVKLLNKNNKKRHNNEIPWSLIVMDKEFNIITEIEINPAKHSMSHIHPTQDGLLILNDIESCIEQKAFLLSLIEIEKK